MHKRFTESKIQKFREKHKTESSNVSLKNHSLSSMVPLIGSPANFPSEFLSRKTYANLKLPKMGLKSKFRKQKNDMFLVRSKDSQYSSYR